LVLPRWLATVTSRTRAPECFACNEAATKSGVMCAISVGTADPMDTRIQAGSRTFGKYHAAEPPASKTEGHAMEDELATTNVNRSYSLGATSIAIFTFVLFFLFPKLAAGEIDARLFQITLVVMGVATFSFVFASLYYYGASLGGRVDAAERAVYARRGDLLWVLGYTLLFLSPTLILFSIGLRAVGSAWLALWLVYLLFVIRLSPRILSARST
jgi:hypothetical protein